jgi:hypothetical protein
MVEDINREGIIFLSSPEGNRVEIGRGEYRSGIAHD